MMIFHGRDPAEGEALPIFRQRTRDKRRIAELEAALGKHMAAGGSLIGTIIHLREQRRLRPEDARRLVNMLMDAGEGLGDLLEGATQ